MSQSAETAMHYQTLSDRERCRLQMLAYQVDGQHHQTGSGEAFLARISRAPEIFAELGELSEVVRARGNLRFPSGAGVNHRAVCVSMRATVFVKY